MAVLTLDAGGDVHRAIARLQELERAIGPQLLRATAVCASRELRKRYQRELRRAAPRETGRLRRSIRVRSRARRDTIDITVQMAFYGLLLSEFSGRHAAWAANVRAALLRQSNGVLAACLAEAIAKLEREIST